MCIHNVTNVTKISQRRQVYKLHKIYFKNGISSQHTSTTSCNNQHSISAAGSALSVNTKIIHQQLIININNALNAFIMLVWLDGHPAAAALTFTKASQ